MPPQGNKVDKPVKQRRITQACDFCHRRSIRCRPASEDSNSCQNCQDFAQPCTYDRKTRRRGAPRRRAPASTGGGGEETQDDDGPGGPALLPQAGRGEGSVDQGVSARYGKPSQSEAAMSTPWKAPYVSSQAIIMDLVELYFEIVYPIFPLFHSPSYIRRISRGEYVHNKSLFAVTMAVCALVSSRVRDGSVTNPRWNLTSFSETDPAIFYAETKRQLADESPSDLNLLRAHAILAIASIQNGNIRDMHRHLGTYHTLVAMDGLHDEANWPPGIGIIEREERRRLHWSIYTLDIYSSVVWGGVIRSREQQSNVLYPTETDDEYIDDSGISLLRPQPDDSSTLGNDGTTSPGDCWLSGWNFITDLYRVMEHALVRFQGNRYHSRSFLRDIFGEQSTATQASVREKVLEMYLRLPRHFKETPPMTYDAKKDRFGFQAANITGSVQLLRMVLFAAGGTSIEERCTIAHEVVNAFISIPVSYLLAISRPQLHHLGGIGTILGSVFEEPLTETDYNSLRSIMHSMAQLLESLETSQHGDKLNSASSKLRSQIARIDAYMATQRETTARAVPDANQLGLDRLVPQSNSTIEFPEVNGGLTGTEWTLQFPPDLLGDLTWNFDFG